MLIYVYIIYELWWLKQLAEREGFEPSVGFPTRLLQSRALNHSATFPETNKIIFYLRRFGNLKI